MSFGVGHMLSPNLCRQASRRDLLLPCAPSTARGEGREKRKYLSNTHDHYNSTKVGLYPWLLHRTLAHDAYTRGTYRMASRSQRLGGDGSQKPFSGVTQGGHGPVWQVRWPLSRKRRELWLGGINVSVRECSSLVLLCETKS